LHKWLDTTHAHGRFFEVHAKSEGNLTERQCPLDFVSITLDIATELERKHAEGM
jgi:hypothetical protein